MRVKAEMVIDKLQADIIGESAIKEVIKEQLSKKLAYEIFKQAPISEDKWFTVGSTKYTLELEIFTPLEYTQFLDDIQEHCKQIIAAGFVANSGGR